jgi:hypothetical protein
MAQYHPEDKIYFGKHAGHTLAEIYRFFPTYIDFLVTYVPGFIIDEQEFLKLPAPTPYITELHMEGKGRIRVINGNSINKTYRYLQEGNRLLPVAYRFNQKISEILRLKREGVYKPPKWERRKTLLLGVPLETHFDEVQETGTRQELD